MKKIQIIEWNYSIIIFISLRKLPTFRDTTIGFRAKWRVKRAQEFHTDDTSLSRSGECFWLVVLHGKFALANQKHYPDLGSDTSSVWNSCARCSDVISQGNQLWRHKMLAVFSGYIFSIWKCLMQLCSFFSFFFQFTSLTDVTQTVGLIGRIK